MQEFLPALIGDYCVDDDDDDDEYDGYDDVDDHDHDVVTGTGILTSFDRLP